MERTFDRSNTVQRVTLGPQTMIGAASGHPVSGRPLDAEQEEIARTLGAQLLRLRITRKLSVRDLERRSGVNRSTISRLEHGLRRPRASTLGWIAYGLDPDAVEAIKRELCAAAGMSLIAESRWSERSHARRAWRAMLTGRMPLPAFIAAPYAVAILGAAYPNRLADLQAVQEAARAGRVPWPEGADGSAEALALGNELIGARPAELARIGRAMAAADAAAAARARRRRERAAREERGAALRSRRALRGVPDADADVMARAMALGRASDALMEADRALRVNW